MAERVHVTSVDVLESFRASLIVYLSKARPALAEISGDVLRTRLWLQSDQRLHWESEVRRRTRDLEQAQQALFSAQLSKLQEATAAQQRAVQKAKQALEEAVRKLRLVKHWTRQFDSLSEPLVKQLERLSTVLWNEMPKAVNYLSQAVGTLDAYADIAPGSASTSPASPESTSPALENAPNQAPGAGDPAL